ncbi:putative receptor-like protein kinase At3g47110 [Humulus lupulus]|uniref:putative receptor-like protein kinase At3g47110 n=1 Tax=Humulus lupulus TaxID=3486 RepID=UPI002B416BA6|nr:putative receptor-like protein kinase At3g47110 [Humulus lupulus]
MVLTTHFKANMGFHSCNILLHFSFLTILICLNSIFPGVKPATLTISTDKEALISVKSTLSFDHTTPNPLSTWDQTSSSPCNWTGVVCNKLGQSVVGLDLSGLGLSGSISPHIGNLSFLNSLQLQNNRFIGTIPSEITKLFRLRLLNVSFNLINGVLPSNLKNLKELKVIDFTENKVSGTLPELSLLTKLEVLKLRQNHFHGGIPQSFGNLSSLTVLNLGTNSLSGDIPNNLGRLHNLKELDITINNLTGTIPPSIYNLTSLVNLAVAANHLWGEIPYDVGVKLPNLLVFNYCFNKFTGRIPGSLHNLTRIQVIRMAHNLLEGPVPPGLGNLPFLEMYNIGFNKILSSGDGTGDGLSFLNFLVNSTRLKFLAIDGNGLEGVIPEAIGNLSKDLSKLYMGGNRIHGEIPNSIGQLKSLTLLNLSSNLITDEIPTQIGELKELQELCLADNKLSGAIPRSLGELKKLNSIDLSGNSLHGYVPSSFENFQSLLSMDLSNNKLNGSIPKECLNLPSLSTVLNLSRNLLSGPLPQEVEKLENVVAIDLSHNLLSGEIPNSIKSCKSLENLLMSNNRFVGPVPKGLAEVKGLEMLDLSSNQLSGSIPIDLQNLRGLKLLNLSFNDLEGVVPKDGVFKNLSSVHLEGNKNICLKFPCLNSRSDSTRKRIIKFIIIGVVTALIFIGFCLVLCLLLHIRKSKSAKIRGDKAFGEVDHKVQHQMVSYEEIRRSTGNFSDDNLLGKGSFGSVYKGYVNLRDGLVITSVKVLDILRTGSSKSFVAECEALRNVRHRNLVRLVTSCSSIDYKNKDFLALVYEYMCNGSLDDWIKGKRRKENGDLLSLIERLNVAIDVASGLDYMHHDCEVPVVHCDIKPSNILLDEDFTAKMGDFGLARLLMMENRETVQTSISSTLKGSIGYIPPEYGLGQKPSTAGDAYSFGVMLLELFTGMSPTHESFTGELNLIKWVESAFPENLMHVIDSELLQFSENSKNEDESIISPEKQCDCMTRVIEIGLSCARDSPDERMSMRLALNSLKTSKHNLLKQSNMEG